MTCHFALTAAGSGRNVSYAMSTTILDRTAHTLRGNRTRAVVGLGVVFVLVAAAAGVLLLTRADAAPPGAETPAPANAHLTQVPGLPAGATDCPPVYSHLLAPFNRGAKGTPATSCGFVEQARRTYDNQPPSAGPQQMRVASPATYKWYDVVCVPTGSYVTCTAGVAAIIYLYNYAG
jgi:hypothetical protein